MKMLKSGLKVITLLIHWALLPLAASQIIVSSLSGPVKIYLPLLGATVAGWMIISLVLSALCVTRPAEGCWIRNVRRETKKM